MSDAIVTCMEIEMTVSCAKCKTQDSRWSTGDFVDTDMEFYAEALVDNGWVFRAADDLLCPKCANLNEPAVEAPQPTPDKILTRMGLEAPPAPVTPPEPVAAHPVAPEPDTNPTPTPLSTGLQRQEQALCAVAHYANEIQDVAERHPHGGWIVDDDDMNQLRALISEWETANAEVLLAVRSIRDAEPTRTPSWSPTPGDGGMWRQPDSAPYHLTAWSDGRWYILRHDGGADIANGKATDLQSAMDAADLALNWQLTGGAA